jgi:hypothetical protein
MDPNSKYLYKTENIVVPCSFKGRFHCIIIVYDYNLMFWHENLSVAWILIADIVRLSLNV